MEGPLKSDPGNEIWCSAVIRYAADKKGRFALEVKLLTYTPNPERVIASAAKCCYSAKDPFTLYNELTDQEVEHMVKHLLESQHTSPIEHANFTFTIKGLSRAASQQLTRHRHMSTSMQSQRYVDMNNVPFTVPSGIIFNASKNLPSAKDIFFGVLKAANDAYTCLVHKYGVAKEDARAILPICAQSNLMITLNAAELYHIFDLRCCVRAQGEFRELADEMLKLCKEAAPILFSKAGASCVHYGYCPEGKQSCGKAPTLSKLLEVYHTFLQGKEVAK
jgi:thymidylate synthase (FAD)